MDARINRFRDLIAFGRPYKVYELVLNEFRLRLYYKDNWKAAYQAHLGAAFYDLPELDVDRGHVIKLRRKKPVSQD